jgi:hypothetical protein
MADLFEYINLSETSLNIREVHTDPAEFLRNYREIPTLEKQAYITHFIVSNGVYLFKDKPILFERIIQYLSDNLNVAPVNIRLIGSAKTGFTISPEEFGKPYISENSDLDFSIFDQSLFTKLEDEFSRWSTAYSSGDISPRNDHEEYYWNANREHVPRILKKGFIDTNKIPNLSQFPITRKLNSSMFTIVNHLQALYSIRTKKATLRVYKDWNVFIRQLKLNTEYVLNQQSEP